MNLVVVLTALGIGLTTLAIIPYLIDTIRGNTKPRIVTWIIWIITNGIASLAAFYSREYPTALLLATVVVLMLIIVSAGWRKGDKSIQKIDIGCFIGAIFGIILWRLLGSADISIIILIATEIIGGLPTIIHAWEKPTEETFVTYFVTFLGSLCILITVDSFTITGFAYPLHMVLFNILISLIIMFRRKRLKAL